MAFSNDPFERLSFGSVYSRSFALLMERLDLFMAVAVLMYVPFVLIQVSFPGAIDDPEATSFMEGTDEDGNPEKILYGKLAGFYAELLFSSFIGIIGNAAIALAVGQMYVNGHPETVPCLKKGAANFCTLFIGQIIVGAAVGLFVFIGFFIATVMWLSGMIFFRALSGLLVVVMAAAYFYTIIALTLFIPAVMIENKSAMDGLVRSFELVSKNFCFVFCTSFCLTIAMMIVSIFFALFSLDGFLGAAIGKLPFLFQFPLQSILITVVYFNLRITHEGMNRDVLAQELNTNQGEYDAVEAEAVAIVDKDEVV